ncbi:MAG TPA: hypothetical protein VFE15_10580 [Marmoricola sp.]|nr:hypothetical protein [Marmoricola sp.]
MRRRSLVTTSALTITSALVVLVPLRAVATDPGPPAHYVVTQLMQVPTGTSGTGYVSPNGRYLMINPGFSADVFDLDLGESIGQVKGSATVQLTPEGIDDNGIVVGTYQDTSVDPALVTGFHWYGKDATHPIGHEVAEEVPGSLIAQYVPYCASTPDRVKDEELQYYGVGADGTAYGLAGCPGAGDTFAIQRPLNGAVTISGGVTGMGSDNVMPNAAFAYGVGENGDIVGSDNIDGNPIQTWNPNGNTTPTELVLHDGTPVDNVGTGMLFRNLDDFVGNSKIHWDNQDFSIPSGLNEVGLLDYGTLVGNTSGFDGGPTLVQPLINGTTTTTALADIATLPVGASLDSVLGVDQAGDIFGKLDNGANQYFFKAVPGTATNPVVPKPTVAISAPLNGHTYTRGMAYQLTYACKAGSGATITSCSATFASGTSLSTLAAGHYTLKVTAKQNDNQTASGSTTFTVVNPAPTIALKTPVNGHVYAKGAKVKASFGCKAGAYTKLASCKGTVAVGKRIATGSVGKHAFTVTAKDADGRTTTKTIHYTVKKKKKK